MSNDIQLSPASISAPASLSLANTLSSKFSEVFFNNIFPPVIAVATRYVPVSILSGMTL